MCNLVIGLQSIVGMIEGHLTIKKNTNYKHAIQETYFNGHFKKQHCVKIKLELN